MKSLLLATLLTFALMSPLATASPAEGTEVGGGNAENRCSPHPYVEELRCRINDAYCALLCPLPNPWRQA